MNNEQIPQAQPASITQTPIQPAVNQQVFRDYKKDNSGLIKTIVIVVLSLFAVTFLGLFIWMTLQFNEVQTDVKGQINEAVAAEVQTKELEMEAEFMEREKYPFRTFSGPVDYGELSFEFPKTWSVYVASSADRGGDYNAYFNPNQVEAVGKDTINALRVTIRDKSFEDVAAEYQRALERTDSGLSVESIMVNGVSANKYIGNIPNTDLSGYIVIFKIRDKTAVIQTDSVLFKDDFDKVIETISFNA